MCVNMTECIRQLKLFINSLYALQQDDKMNLIQVRATNFNFAFVFSNQSFLNSKIFFVNQFFLVCTRQDLYKEL